MMIEYLLLKIEFRINFELWKSIYLNFHIYEINIVSVNLHLMYYLI